MKKELILTKTKYVQFLQCPKSLWLTHFNKESKNKTSAFDQLKMDEGHKVGSLATQHPLFEGGVLIDTLNTAEAVTRTKQALESADVKFIYEAAFLITFKNQKCLIRVDILQKNTDNSVTIIEVKSSTKPKPEYFHDIAFQKWVIEQDSLTVADSFLVYVNKQYVFKSQLNLQEYFIIENVNTDIDAPIQKVPDNVEICTKLATLELEPNYPLGSHCKSPHVCPFLKHCDKTELDSVENLRNLHYKRKEELKLKNINTMREISEQAMLNFTPTQQIQILCAKAPSVFHFEPDSINGCLKNLKYPLNFLDFEALLSAVPYFDGMKPQQFVVYQASLHQQPAANQKLAHKCYLHEAHTDPRESVLKFLDQNLGEEGSIIVYHQQFEEGQLHNLKRDFPEYATKIDNWISRLWDLETIFSSFFFYDNQQRGSTSIKKVFPVLVPSLSYDELFIQDGNSSVAYYLKLIQPETSLAEKEFLKEKLTEYNSLDTFAMVKILNKIKWLITKKAA